MLAGPAWHPHPCSSSAKQTICLPAYSLLACSCLEQLHFMLLDQLDIPIRASEHAQQHITATATTSLTPTGAAVTKRTMHAEIVGGWQWNLEDRGGPAIHSVCNAACRAKTFFIRTLQTGEGRPFTRCVVIGKETSTKDVCEDFLQLQNAGCNLKTNLIVNLRTEEGLPSLSVGSLK
eukprot:scaffold153077_cov19-Tisochrysis_lutea.AAC.5